MMRHRTLGALVATGISRIVTVSLGSELIVHLLLPKNAMPAVEEMR